MRHRVVLHRLCRRSGEAAQADPAIRETRRSTTSAPMPFPALQSLFDPLFPPGLQWYWRADFVKELSDKAIELHVEHGSRLPTMHSTMHLYPINGAAHRVGKNDTAFSYRDANWAEVIVGVDPDPANKDKIIAWTKDYWDALHPYSAGGAYVNFMMDEGQDRVQATYRDNYQRLATVKKKYDPDELLPREPEHPPCLLSVRPGVRASHICRGAVNPEGKATQTLQRILDDDEREIVGLLGHGAPVTQDCLADVLGVSVSGAGDAALQLLLCVGGKLIQQTVCVQEQHVALTHQVEIVHRVALLVAQGSLVALRIRLVFAGLKSDGRKTDEPILD